jgi:hypothetical protein
MTTVYKTKKYLYDDNFEIPARTARRHKKARIEAENLELPLLSTDYTEQDFQWNSNESQIEEVEFDNSNEASDPIEQSEDDAIDLNSLKSMVSNEYDQADLTAALLTLFHSGKCTQRFFNRMLSLLSLLLPTEKKLRLHSIS